MTTDTLTTIRADQAQPGDMLDLEGDEYADPNGDGTCPCSPGCDHWTAFEYEYAEVYEVSPASFGPHDHVTLDTSLGVVTVPASHMLKRWS